jgi:uncharacterized protein YceH (UPF0502 family)
MSERRSSARQKSFLKGQIMFNNRRSVVECLIRDISADGARLILSQTGIVPDVIELYIPQKEETLRARVQRRADSEIGVAFLADTAAPAAGSGDLAERVKQLEAEVAALKRLVKKLRADMTDSDAA